MNVLGVGVSELFFIVAVALIILGPKDMQKAGRSIGGFLPRIVTSSECRLVRDATRQIKTLPDQLMREASLDAENRPEDLNQVEIPASDTTEVGNVEQPIQPTKWSKRRKLELKPNDGNDMSA